MGLHLGKPIPASRVIERLSHNYPPDALNWVRDAKWYGPLDVPLASVDFGDADSWAAAHQPDRVRHFAAEKPGDVNPAVLVLEHGDTRGEVVDGHHRALADREEGRPVVGYVGVPPAGDVRWRETHTAQRHQGADAANKAARPVAAGLVVRAADTGRVLMLQRADDDKDPAAGYWEFPGGRLDGGESALEAARREWSEETGMDIPDGQITGSWVSKDGIYHGFVHTVPHEADVPIHDGRDEVDNPDDPDGDHVEALAFWDPAHIKHNPAVRPEVLANRKRMMRALRANEAAKAVVPDLRKCLTCGCDQPSAAHGDARNITLQDLQEAARAAGVSLLVAWQNMQHTIDHARPLSPGDDDHPDAVSDEQRAAEKVAFLDALAGSSDRVLSDMADVELAKVREGAVGDYRARHLIHWFNEGGGGKWVWGQPGDLTACHLEAVKHMPSNEAWAFCNNRHHDALGTWNNPKD